METHTSVRDQLAALIATLKSLVAQARAVGVPIPDAARLLVGEGVAPFSRTLYMDAVGPDVLALQQFLNHQGFLVAKSGPGSPGNETQKFGAGTWQALCRFQEAYAEEILEPLGLRRCTGIFGPATRAVVEKMY